ncbi:MAG: hydrogenase [Bacteroidota bacterium]
MNTWLESILVLLILSNLVLAGSSRVWKCIRILAVQGILLGLLILITHAGHLSPHILLLAAGNVLVKAVLFPWLLVRAVQKADVNQAIPASISYGWSLLLATMLLPLSLWLGARLPLPDPVSSPLIVPVALYTIFVGLFLFASRKKAITQVLSYLVLENGITLFGLALIVEVPFLIELGILLDLLGAVFVMGLALSSINQSFDTIDSSKLSTLKE